MDFCFVFFFPSGNGNYLGQTTIDMMFIMQVKHGKTRINQPYGVIFFAFTSHGDDLRLFPVFCHMFFFDFLWPSCANVRIGFELLLFKHRHEPFLAAKDMWPHSKERCGHKCWEMLGVNYSCLMGISCRYNGISSQLYKLGVSENEGK